MDIKFYSEKLKEETTRMT